VASLIQIGQIQLKSERELCEVIFARTLNQAVGLLIPDIQRNKKTIFCQPKLVSCFSPWAGGFQYTNWISSEEKAQYFDVLNRRLEYHPIEKAVYYQFNFKIT
jgi:hypothetical protein